MYTASPTSAPASRHRHNLGTRGAIQELCSLGSLKVLREACHLHLLLACMASTSSILRSLGPPWRTMAQGTGTANHINRMAISFVPTKAAGAMPTLRASEMTRVLWPGTWLVQRRTPRRFLAKDTSEAALQISSQTQSWTCSHGPLPPSGELSIRFSKF